LFESSPEELSAICRDYGSANARNYPVVSQQEGQKFGKTANGVDRCGSWWFSISTANRAMLAE
jgi:hypothetical protein